MRTFPWQALNTANWDIQEHPAQPGQVVALGAVGAVPAGLKLVKSQSYPTGVIVSTYRPEGAVMTGSFQLAEPSEAERGPRRNLT